MTERERGWYRVGVISVRVARIIYWDGENWHVGDERVDDDYFIDIDPIMVMTREGEIVYHNAQHDPLYNTAQEQ